MKLFLTSSCISENLREPFLDFLERDPGQIKFYFIPTAIDVEEDKFYTAKSMDDFAAIGINPIWYSLKFKTQKQIARELAGADVIWVGGGNTFYLLDTARKVGVMEVVTDLVLNKGIIFGGTSAGTILATPSIEIAGWGDDADANDVGIDDFTALDFVSILTHVHYNPSTDKDMLFRRKKELPIYAITDGSAMEVNGDIIKVHGDVEIIK